ncbi:hypothetical protein T492DRAFT_849191 [Pavlovales sp. CCMP2436]|nr:hypothetical protein T492DRAFT_849191 [Pavlovales sp. CCMP2436]
MPTPARTMVGHASRVLSLPPPRVEFVVLCHAVDAVSAAGHVDFTELSRGRVDMAARCISAATFVDHGVRSDVRLWCSSFVVPSGRPPRPAMAPLMAGHTRAEAELSRLVARLDASTPATPDGVREAVGCAALGADLGAADALIASQRAREAGSAKQASSLRVEVGALRGLLERAQASVLYEQVVAQSAREELHGAKKRLADALRAPPRAAESSSGGAGGQVASTPLFGLRASPLSPLVQPSQPSAGAASELLSASAAPRAPADDPSPKRRRLTLEKVGDLSFSELYSHYAQAEEGRRRAVARADAADCQLQTIAARLEVEGPRMARRAELLADARARAEFLGARLGAALRSQAAAERAASDATALAALSREGDSGSSGGALAAAAVAEAVVAGTLRAADDADAEVREAAARVELAASEERNMELHAHAVGARAEADEAVRARDVYLTLFRAAAAGCSLEALAAQFAPAARPGRLGLLDSSRTLGGLPGALPYSPEMRLLEGPTGGDVAGDASADGRGRGRSAGGEMGSGEASEGGRLEVWLSELGLVASAANAQSLSHT